MKPGHIICRPLWTNVLTFSLLIILDHPTTAIDDVRVVHKWTVFPACQYCTHARRPTQSAERLHDQRVLLPIILHIPIYD